MPKFSPVTSFTAVSNSWIAFRHTMVTSNVLKLRAGSLQWLHTKRDTHTHTHTGTGTHTLLSLSHRPRILNSLRIATPENIFSAQEYTVTCKDIQFGSIWF
jgi:hypothetical protein